jgi:hypothetical protein
LDKPARWQTLAAAVVIVALYWAIAYALGLSLPRLVLMQLVSRVQSAGLLVVFGEALAVAVVINAVAAGAAWGIACLIGPLRAALGDTVLWLAVSIGLLWHLCLGGFLVVRLLRAPVPGLQIGEPLLYFSASVLAALLGQALGYLAAFVLMRRLRRESRVGGNA